MNEVRNIIVASEVGIFIGSLADISNAIGQCIGAEGLILAESDLAPDVFNLRTGLAGELFQKCMNYHVRLAIVLPEPQAYGERIAELAYEHRSDNMIRFVRSVDDARAWLST